MKVVCGSCGAKYSVADDKVAGKTVKIRCKKCSEVIVVHGEQQNPFEEDEATRVFDYGGEAAWHVVVNGEQQGPLAPLQVGALLMEGKIDAEAYVWKEGFDGWKPLREIPELASLLAGGKGGEAQQVEADLESDGGADLFGGGAAASAGGDLFASAPKASSAFSGGEEDDGVVASAPSSPRVSSQQASMTGQRNENSVLFSLSNLQALATGPSTGSSSSSSSASAAAPAPAASKPVGHAVGEASGLIDIRALASATSAVGANKPASSSANVDDLLSIGAGPSPLASPLAAPVLAPIAPKREEEARSGSNKGLIFGMVGFGVVLLGVVGFLGYKVLNQTPQERIVERVVVQSGDDDDDGNSGSTDNAPAAAASDTAQAATGTTPAAGSSRTTGTTGSTRTTGTTGTASTSNTAAASTASTTTAMTTAAAAEPAAGATTDRMRQLLAGMTTTAPAPAPAPTPAMAAETAAPAGGGPSRAEIASALGGVRGAVTACGDGATHGVASVRVTFAPSGSVTGAAVGGDFAGTPVAGCISRAVRGASISPFSGAATTVTYPYRL